MAQPLPPGAARARIALQIFGSKGSIAYDQERMNEFELYQAQGRGDRTGLPQRSSPRPAHPPYDRFIPAPGHGLGFNDLKIIECRELIRAISGEPSSIVTFEDGLRDRSPFTPWHSHSTSAAGSRSTKVDPLPVDGAGGRG